MEIEVNSIREFHRVGRVDASKALSLSPLADGGEPIVVKASLR